MDKSRKRAVLTSKNYILGHWPAVMNGVRNRQENIHCSAEGHASHIYADLPLYSIPYPKIKKMAALKNHIWGFW